MAWPRAVIMRTDLAEIENAQYGILSADKWRSIIGPILNAQIDQLDLKGQSKNLRPRVQRALNALLDKIDSNKPGGIQGMMVSKMIASLRPQVPEYTDVVMGQLVNQGNAKELQGFHSRRAGQCGREYVRQHGHDHLQRHPEALWVLEWRGLRADPWQRRSRKRTRN